MKILAFAATNSSTSINKQLVTYVTSLVKGADIEIIDINDYEMPIFSQDRETKFGQLQPAKTFFDKITQADALIISFAEHNGTYTAAFKNLFDWTSRIDQKFYQNTPMLLLATSPGPGGASSVLLTAQNSAPYFSGDVRAAISLPSFYENFDQETNLVTLPEKIIEIENGIKKLMD